MSEVHRLREEIAQLRATLERMASRCNHKHEQCRTKSRHHYWTRLWDWMHRGPRG